MPKEKRQDALRRKGKTPSPNPGRARPIALTQESVDALQAGDKAARREVAKSLAAAVPSDVPADAKVQEGPKLLPLPISADEIKEIRKARVLPRKLVARLLDRKVVDPPRKNPEQKREEPQKKPE